MKDVDLKWMEQKISLLGVKLQHKQEISTSLSKCSFLLFLPSLSYVLPLSFTHVFSYLFSPLPPMFSPFFLLIPSFPSLGTILSLSSLFSFPFCLSSSFPFLLCFRFVLLNIF
jgi:hypothetical protein